MKTHTLYRFYDAAGTLLYIGITMSPPRRFAAHRNSQWWWNQVASIDLEQFPCRANVLFAEFWAIQSETPLFNVTHNNQSGRGDVENVVMDDCWWALRDQELERQADEYESPFDSDDLVPVIHFTGTG